jgi:pyruvate, water dikinase
MTVTPYAIAFDALGLEQLGLVGGKSAHLGDLRGAGFPVPPGFAVTTAAFERVVDGEFRQRVDELVADLHPDDVARLEVEAARLRELIHGLPVPDDVLAAIGGAYAELGSVLGLDAPAVAVRSSAVAEDAAEASFAGVQDTYLWIAGIDDVVRHIRACWASYFNAEALAYRARQTTAAPGMSVAVQTMVDARVAGVMFTLNPVSGDRSCVAIDASYGLGVTVVGGEVTPDTFLVSKVTREVLRSDIGEKAIECVADTGAGGTLIREVSAERRAQLCLEPAELEQLVELARQIERHYGRPQDIEWAIDRRLGELLVLQSRAETVWSQKPAGEAPAPAGALAAITSAFIGGTSRK